MSAKTSTRICIIDDDDAVRDSLSELLRAHGYDVCDFPSALAYLNGGARNKAFDCAIVDLHMPGMSGLELLDTVQKRTASLPVVMITGRTDSALKERARRRGVVAVLDKPIAESALLAAITKANSARTDRGHT